MLLLREKGTFNISDVEMAVLETNGQLSILLKSDQQPLTPHTSGVSVQMEHEYRVLIMDGKLLRKGLEEHGYTEEWLLSEIKKQGATEIKDVFLAQVDSFGKVYVDLYEEDKN